MEWRHPDWHIDTLVLNETMKIAVTRYLARTIGTVLADTTTSGVDAAEKVKSVLASNPQVQNGGDLINLTVAALSDVGSLEQATSTVYDAWKEVAAETGLNSEVALKALIAVTRQSCTEMMDILLRKPKGGVDSVIGSIDNDSMMKTVFGIDGAVVKIEVVLLRGRFSSFLGKELNDSFDRYQRDKAEVTNRCEAPADYATKIELRELQSGPSNYTEVKASPDEFRRAYFAATMRYAVKYAEGLWKQRNPRIA
jgi:hypothetical protein